MVFQRVPVLVVLQTRAADGAALAEGVGVCEGTRTASVTPASLAADTESYKTAVVPASCCCSTLPAEPSKQAESGLSLVLHTGSTPWTLSSSWLKDGVGAVTPPTSLKT